MISIEEAANKCSQLYADTFGHQPAFLYPLPAAGSNRRYFRINASSAAQEAGLPRTLIGVVGTDADEDNAFVQLSHHFAGHDLPVPCVHAVSNDLMAYLQDDLGDQSLYALLMSDRNADGTLGPDAMQAATKTMKLLPQLQFSTVGHADIFTYCYPQQQMDMTNVMFDLNYFKYNFLKFQPIEFNEYKLQHDFEALSRALLADPADTFLYRDFQSRNVMLVDGEPFFIDFQGGRRGPVYYDVASFLWQSSARIAPSDRQQLIDVYLDSLRTFRPVDRTEFIHNLQAFVLFRTLQVLGAYGYRGLWEKKDYFLKSIPFALDNLSDQLATGACDAYPYLKHVCQRLVDINEANKRQQAEEKRKRDRVEEYLSNDVTYCNATPTRPLVVRVYSFAFKKGIPADNTGNGGGYVFDCRSTHNPGRYEEYKPLTGLDQPVIDFLESDGEILTFLQSVYKLVDFHVERFISRGFTDMQINFGCTGGKHRSVYCAQHTAQHLNEKYGIEVHIIHRERNITSVLEAKK